MEKVIKVERQQSTDLSIFFQEKKTRQRENKEKKGNERKKDSSPDSEPKLGEVSVSVREEWGGAGGGTVGGGRPFD